jgi:hypothetical protein
MSRYRPAKEFATYHEIDETGMDGEGGVDGGSQARFCS